MARYYENRGTWGSDKYVLKGTESAVYKAVSRYTERTSCDRKYIHESCSQYAGTGQCRHSIRTESYGRTSGTEHKKGHCQQSDDNVPCAEYLRTYNYSDKHNGLQSATWSRTAYRCIRTDTACYVLFNSGRHYRRKRLSENKSSEQNYTAVLRWSQPVHSRYNILLRHAFKRDD